MEKSELAKIIADAVCSEIEAIEEYYETEDYQGLVDTMYEYLSNIDQD